MCADTIIVCATRERADAVRRAGIAPSGARYISVKSATNGCGDGMSGVVLIEAGAIDLAQRIGRYGDLMWWAAGCACGWNGPQA